MAGMGQDEEGNTLLGIVLAAAFEGWAILSAGILVKHHCHPTLLYATFFVDVKDSDGAVLQALSRRVLHQV
jgi:hypothetical protein